MTDTKMNSPLDRSKDRFVACVVVGITPEGLVDLETDMSSYPHMQHLLSRASFELFVHENSSEKKREAEKAVEAETKPAKAAKK